MNNFVESAQLEINQRYIMLTPGESQAEVVYLGRSCDNRLILALIVEGVPLYQIMYLPGDMEKKHFVEPNSATLNQVLSQGLK